MSHSAKHEKIHQESDVSFYGIKEERVKCDAWSESHAVAGNKG
jgi:hypothetical protein